MNIRLKRININKNKYKDIYINKNKYKDIYKEN